MTTPIFTFSGRAKNLLPTLDYHMNIQIPQVEIPRPFCHDNNHTTNVIINGTCESCGTSKFFNLQ